MIVETFATRAEWLAARRNPTAIGASEAAAVLGIHPHLDAWTLWQGKRGASSESEGGVLARGHRWESAVLAEYEDMSGARVVAPGAHFGRPGHLVTLASAARPWLRESPDAFAIDPRGDLGHLEAKTAMDPSTWSPTAGVIVERWEDGAELHVPPHYAVQAYVQLEVTGLPWNDVCALVPHGGWLAVRWVRILRDPETQGQIVAALDAWRDRHLIAGEAPDIDGSRSCNRFLAAAFQARAQRVAAPDEAEMVRELARLRAEAKAIGARVDTLANTLVARADGARLLLSPAKGAPYGQPQANAGRTTVDVEKLRAEFPEAHAACARRGNPFVTFNTYRFTEQTDVG